MQMNKIIMNCKISNCFTEEEIQKILDNISKLTGLCFPSIGTTFVSPNIPINCGFIITNTGGYLLQGDFQSKFELNCPN